jgi:hypothetical protein
MTSSRPRSANKTGILIFVDKAATAAEGVRLALALFEFGESMTRQRIAREHPGLSRDEVEAHLTAWLGLRPGAERGDAEGRSVSWPRSDSL